MEYNGEIVLGSGFTGNKKQELTDVNYSTPGQFQSTNNISKTYNSYDPRQSNLSLHTVHQTMDSNKKSIDGEHILMDGAPKTHSITQVIDDHPYWPYFTKITFETLTQNEKESRKQLTSQLYKGSTDNILNNILRMEKDAEKVVSPYFLPSPNQINKIKANLKKMPQHCKR